MSLEYAKKYGDEKVSKEVMRDWCKRPGKKDKNGKNIYLTEQAHKKETDINLIIQKYDKTGLISHVSSFEGRFGDLTGLEFKEMMDKVTNAQSMFNNLPAEIRKEFDNTPEKLLTFMENPENRQRAIELGLIDSEWTEATDGLGEHVKEGENIKEEEETPTKP
jgi:phage internal scaffolding protein